MREGRAPEGRPTTTGGRRRGATAARPDGIPDDVTRATTRRRRKADPVDAAPVVAGYRLVRLVGRGRRCEVHLGRPSGGRGGGAENVAVKIVPVTDRSRGEAEILALQAVASEHVVALRDVATLADGSLCIVQSLGSRGTAASLLARRGALSPGETVTLVVSLLRGLGDLHDAGYAHGALDLTHVVMDASGCPMLGGLGSSRALDGGGAEHVHGLDPVEEDLTRVARIVRALRDPADARGRVSDDRWQDWLEVLDLTVHGESGLSAHDLADRLLDVADGAPLADAAEPAHADGALQGTAADAPAPTGDARGGDDGLRRARSTTATAGPGRRHRADPDHRARRSAARVQRWRQGMRGELASVRPRVWALGASTLLLLVAVTVAMPSLADAAHSRSTTAEDPSAGPTFPPSATTKAETVPTPGPESTTAADAQASATADPGAAAPALLRMRATCLRDADVTCLSGVDESGSAVDDADRARIADGRGDAVNDAALHAGDRIGVVQRLGDGAVVELQAQHAGGRRTASLLMVRGEAGWRIRDLMDDR
jgi:serine/threonine protein kinase